MERRLPASFIPMMPARPIDMRWILVALLGGALFASCQSDDSGKGLKVRPAVFVPADAGQQAVYASAFRVVAWGGPAAGFEFLSREVSRKFGGEGHQIVYWPALSGWRNQTLAPDPDVVTVIALFDASEGPVVLELPPADGGSLVGTIMNSRQTALEDVGTKSGKVVFLPPGYDTKKVPSGYLPIASDTRRGCALLRMAPSGATDEAVARAAAAVKGIRLYPLSKAADPPPTTFLDAGRVVFDSRIQYDLRFFQSLHRMVQAEPWLAGDSSMIGPLMAIGIERGKPFSPDSATREILEHAAADARAWLDSKIAAAPPIDPGRRWFMPVRAAMRHSGAAVADTPSGYPAVGGRVAYAFPFAGRKRVDGSPYELLATVDAAGRALDGRMGYRLRIPAGVPVTRHWSVSVYDRASHAFIRRSARPGRSSLAPGLAMNDDGSVDIYIGFNPPNGRESNWIPTDPDGRFEVLARFYGPKQPLIEGTWKLDDLERID